MNKQFSVRLQRAIQSLGVSPTHFARKAGVPQGTISKCLHGHVPSPKILLRISKTSGTSVDWLLTGKEPAGVGGDQIAEAAASYGLRAPPAKSKADEEVWVAKLLKVLRSRDRRKKQTIKELLDVLSR
jgi:transcriptional regulator with XRE-family HTH domain